MDVTTYAINTWFSSRQLISTIDRKVTVGMKTPVTFGDPCEPDQSFLISLNERIVRFRCPPAFLHVHLNCTL